MPLKNEMLDLVQRIVRRVIRGVAKHEIPVADITDEEIGYMTDKEIAAWADELLADVFDSRGIYVDADDLPAVIEMVVDEHTKFIAGLIKSGAVPGGGKLSDVPPSMLAPFYADTLEKLLTEHSGANTGLAHQGYNRAAETTH